VDGNSYAEISRRGQEILVSEFQFSEFRSKPLGPKACSGGVPTVVNTDTIDVLVRGDSDVTTPELLLNGGPFAPGVTPEPEGAPEIEIQFRGEFVPAIVTGTPRADEFQWGPGGANAGLNLNPRSNDDHDVDFTVRGKGSDVGADGAGGNDRVIPAPGVATSGDVFADGGNGNDRLIAPRKAASVMNGGAGNDVLTGGELHDLLSGNGGNDRVAGNSGRDEIDGGRGRDLLLGGRGHDAIVSRDGRRDRVRCGPGRDRVRADRRDRLHGCERVGRR
jgi:Ca2+-binding RTX toxin-like protein